MPHPAIRHARTAVPPSSSPLWVADQYYVASSFPDEQTHITGEFARRFGSQPSLGSLLAPDATVALRSVRERADSVTIAATVTSPDRRRVAEWYTYLVSDSGTWKMYAVRTVHFSPRYYSALDSLAREWRAPDAPRGAEASMALAAGSDSMVRAFVATHAGRLDSLVDAYRAVPDAPAMIDVGDSAAMVRRRRAAVAAPATVHRLLIANDVSTVFHNPANPGCTFVRINGEGRRQVGAFRADSGCRVPPMDPAGLIYTEHVQGRWYVYRAI